MLFRSASFILQERPLFLYVESGLELHNCERSNGFARSERKCVIVQCFSMVALLQICLLLIQRRMNDALLCWYKKAVCSCTYVIIWLLSWKGGA